MLISEESVRNTYKQQMSEVYSLVNPEYKGNILHYLARDQSIPDDAIPYAVAMLRYLGCDFYTQQDSNGNCTCLLMARRMKSQDIFMSSDLLLNWLLNKEETEKVRKLLNL